MGGKDLHIGDWEWGILPATAPLSISTMSIAGIALAFAREGSQRVAVSFIGDGGSSLGEWHEAINVCAARRLPAIFCIENNQIALSTPVSAQSAVRVFADKARGYGIPGITIDGTDPDEVAAAFAWAAERGRAALGPTLIELVTHAHGRARASRRHAVSGEGVGAGVDLSAAGARCVRRPRGLRTLGAEGSHRLVRRAARVRRGDRARRPRQLEAGGGGARRGRGPRGDRRTLAESGRRRSRSLRRGRAARASRAARAVHPSVGGPRSRVARGRRRAALRQEGTHLPRRRRAGSRRRAPRRFARVRLRRGRRRPLRQRVPAAAAAARRVRRSHHQLTDRRERRAGRVRRRGAGRTAARLARCSSTTSSPAASISW